MKIIILSHAFYPVIGGVETISEFLAQSFLKDGHEVHIITWSIDESYKHFPFKIIRKPTLSQLFKEHAWADIVFENNLCLRLAWPNLLIKRPLYIALHTWISRNDGKISIKDKIKLNWLKRAQRVMACSEAIRLRSKQNSIVINNPYDAASFQIIPDVLRSIEFVFLGRLVSDKGADIAIKAFHKFLIEKKFYGAGNFGPTLTIIGDGPEREELQNMVTDAGLIDRINFTGSLRGEALVRCLNQHKFLLVPSVWEEPFGIVALEGMACGCIPIVSNGGGLPDAVGKAGMTFKRGDVDSLYQCMNNIVKDLNLQTKLREAASEHLEAHQPTLIARKYLSVIESSLIEKV